MREKICDRCGAPSPAAANFCGRCGQGFSGHAIRSVTPAVPVMQRWRQLSYSLTRKEVRKLIGEPLRVELPEKPGPFTVETWTYEYETRAARVRARGVISFNAGEGRILRWVEPDWESIGETGGPRIDGETEGG